MEQLGTRSRTEGIYTLAESAVELIGPHSIRRLRGRALRRMLGDGPSRLIQGFVMGAS